MKQYIINIFTTVVGIKRLLFIGAQNRLFGVKMGTKLKTGKLKCNYLIQLMLTVVSFSFISKDCINFLLGGRGGLAQFLLARVFNKFGS